MMKTRTFVSSSLLLATLGVGGALTAPARAQATDLSNVDVVPTPPYPPGAINILPTFKCKRGDGSACTRADLANPHYRQILVLPTGFADVERAAFWADFDTIIAQMSNTGTIWSTTKKPQILYVGYFTGGGSLGSATAAFGGKVLPHPIRDYALTLSLDAVKVHVDAIKTNVPALRPMGVAVLFNTSQGGITPNAAPPSVTQGSYGVAKLTRGHVAAGPYVATHELAHAALNFVDEYVESGFENLNIRTMDALTPLLLLDGTWGGFTSAIDDLFDVYDYRVSEILADNGNHNVSTSSIPSTVYSPISAAQRYPYEGGMFFGRGTFHAQGKNLMNSDRISHGADDGFAYAHSGSQQMLVNTAFGAAPYRANDRLRTAGPTDGWPRENGAATTVMMFDADKHNHFHKTQQYVVQVGWWERHWKTCWWQVFPYPCYDDVWTTATKNVSPTVRTVDLKASSLYGLASLTQSVLCGAGVTEVPQPGGSSAQLCDEPFSTVSSALLPTIKLRTPYQTTTVPASQWFTQYWWRFATKNDATYSGWTGWSSFYRSF